MKTAVLIGAAAAVAFGAGCHRRTDLETDLTQRGLDFGTGAIQGTIRWNGVPIATPLEVGNGHELLITDGNGIRFWISDATFAATNIAAGSHTLGLYAAGCGGATDKLGDVTFVVASNSTTVADFDLTATTGLVTGTVTANGAPVPGAYVSIPSACDTSSSTDAEGRFSFHLPPGAYTANVGAASGSFGTFAFTIAAGQTTDVSAIANDAGQVQGTIRWNGAPIAPPLEVGNGHELLVSDGNGIRFWINDATFTTTSIAAGSHTLGLYAAGCGGADDKIGEVTFVVAANSTTVADFDLTASAGRVTGTLTVNGAPAANAYVTIPSVCGTATSTDAEGRFAFHLPPGAYTANVGSAAGSFGSFAFTIAAGQTTDVGAIANDVGQVQGTIRWNGAPIFQPLEVGNAHELLISDGNGIRFWINDATFAATNIAAGSHTFGLYAAGCGGANDKIGEVTFNVNGNSTTIADFDLTATAGRVRGTVTANGAAVPGAYVIVPGVCSTATLTDGDGQFSILLPPGSHTAQVGAPAGTFGSFSFGVLAGRTADIDSVNTPAQMDVKLDLLGGIQAVNGLALDFFNVTSPGNTVIVSSASCGGSPCSAPPTGYQIAGSHYWDISTTATYAGPIVVCLHYDPKEICGGLTSCGLESSIVLLHDAGAGFVNITKLGSLNTQTKQICGTTTSLSPFAIAVPLTQPNTPPTVTVPADTVADATGPGGATVTFAATATDAEDVALTPTCVPASGATFPIGSTTVACSATDSAGATGAASFTVTVSDTAPPVPAAPPATVVAYATTTSGATVSFTAPAFSDAVDGAVAAHCAPASGAKFAPGKTTVTCTATDAHGNTGSASFTVWVQYQAPTDGMFFLKPIRSDGSSIFRVGRAVPVKFQLTGASAGITNLVAKLVVTKISDQVRGSADDQSDEDGDDTDFLFKYRKLAKIYGYRWKTVGQTQGTYRLTADLGDRVVHEINVSLKVKP
jgi:hypothetical protein